MASIRIPQTLTRLTAGEADFELSVDSYRGLLRALDARHPGIGSELERLAIAIDGTIYQEPLLEVIDAGSDVHFLPRIEGG